MPQEQAEFIAPFSKAILAWFVSAKLLTVAEAKEVEKKLELSQN
jgi:hypothetical protein